MACRRSRDNWHSYVKKSLSAAELIEMTIHLEQCAKCREIVSAIRETTKLLASSRVSLVPPTEIRLNVMKAIDKTKYKKETYSPHLSLSLRLLGFSLVTTGIILLAINLNPKAQGLEKFQMAEVNFQIGKEIALPLDNIGQTVSVAVWKLGSLSGVRNKN